jgi:hypothetical protein
MKSQNILEVQVPCQELVNLVMSLTQTGIGREMFLEKTWEGSLLLVHLMVLVLEGQEQGLEKGKKHLTTCLAQIGHEASQWTQRMNHHQLFLEVQKDQEDLDPCPEMEVENIPKLQAGIGAETSQEIA